MNKINYLVSLKQIHCKPSTQDEIEEISKSFVFTGTTVPELAMYAAEPYSLAVAPGVFKNNFVSATSWQSQQLIYLDFDSGITIKEVLERFKEFGVTPNYYYTTFSHTQSNQRFRIVLCLEAPINDRKALSNLLKGFKIFFPEVNDNFLEPTQFFFGGKQSKVLNDKLIDIQTLVDIIDPFIIVYDSMKTRNIVSKREFLLNNYNDTHFKTNRKHQSDLKKLKSLKSNKCDLNKLINKVKIFQDFLEGKYLSYPQLFGIGTSLHWLNGGVKLFKQTLKKHIDSDKTKYPPNVFGIMTYLKVHDYIPINLKKFSPYEEDWKYKNLVSVVCTPKGEIERFGEPTWISLEEGERRLNDELERVLKAKDNKIYIFKASPGLGKSKYLINLEKVTIAFPTHNLKDEVGSRMLIPFNKVPNKPKFDGTEINLHRDNLYKMGLNSEVKSLYETIVSKDSTYSQEDIKKAKDFLKSTEPLKDCKNTLLTTHHRALKSYSKQDTLIFDEDPISTILSVKTIYMNELISINNKLPNESKLNKIIECVRQSEPGLVHVLPKLKINRQKLTSTLISNPIESNLMEFLDGGSFIVEKNNSNILFYLKRWDLPKDKKVIILSATPLDFLYKNLYGDRVEIIDISNVEHRGTLIQHTGRSCSKESLNDEYIHKIRDNICSLPTITFKSKKEKFPRISPMHFYNCMGYNGLEGQDIAVVGTPHNKDSVYRLYAHAIGINPNDEGVLKNRRVNYGNHGFVFMTFENPELQQIQLSMIESQIKQAIGRARLIRYDCYVLLYSNLPLDGAKFSNAFDT